MRSLGKCTLPTLIYDCQNAALWACTGAGDYRRKSPPLRATQRPLPAAPNRHPLQTGQGSKIVGGCSLGRLTMMSKPDSVTSPREDSQVPDTAAATPTCATRATRGRTGLELQPRQPSHACFRVRQRQCDRPSLRVLWASW